jgi:hypothetical protein
MADIGPVIGLGYRIAQKFVKTEVSVIAYGAEMTGKSSFVRRLQGRAYIKDVFDTNRSYGTERHLIRYNPSPTTQDVTVRVRFIDIGGHAQLTATRRQALNDNRPLGLLFFLDHQSLTQRGPDNEQSDDGTLDRSRLERHHQMFKELADILENHPPIRSACNAIIVVLNKYDLWRGKIPVECFDREFRPDITELMKIGRITNVPALLPCSIKTGDGVSEIMAALLRMSGWELQFPLGVTIRFKSPVLE